MRCPILVLQLDHYTATAVPLVMVPLRRAAPKYLLSQSHILGYFRSVDRDARQLKFVGLYQSYASSVDSYWPFCHLKRLHFARQHQLTATAYMPQDFLLQLGDLFPQHRGRTRQPCVVRLQDFHFLLQSGYAFQLASPALSRCQTVPQPLAFCLYLFLVLHVDRGHRR